MHFSGNAFCNLIIFGKENVSITATHAHTLRNRLAKGYQLGRLRRIINSGYKTRKVPANTNANQTKPILPKNFLNLFSFLLLK
jgi:hypothetical protein